MVQLFVPPRGSRQLCTPLAARYGLAEQVYHYVCKAKNILPYISTVPKRLKSCTLPYLCTINLFPSAYCWIIFNKTSHCEFLNNFDLIVSVADCFYSLQAPSCGYACATALSQCALCMLRCAAATQWFQRTKNSPKINFKTCEIVWSYRVYQSELVETKCLWGIEGQIFLLIYGA